MTGMRLILIFVIWLAGPRVLADEVNWGNSVNGLRLSIAIVPVEGQQGNVQVLFQNIGREDLPLRIGVTVRPGDPIRTSSGELSYATEYGCRVFGSLRFFVRDANERVLPANLVARAGSVPYREPCTITLPPGESRNFQESLSSFRITKPSGITTRIFGPGKLWAEFESGTVSDKAETRCGGERSCWVGKIASNAAVIP